ncbi:MAG: amidohydrolase/deacetylase family metallohydrolase [Pseudomonadota bacterium]
MKSYDLLLCGARVIDPSQAVDGVMDVAFANGRVVELGAALDATKAKQVETLTDCIVTPGLIDLHTHVYWGGTSLGVEADQYCRASAVTTVVDTGSVGPGNFAGFRRHVIEHAKSRILAYLHISHAGIYAFSNRVMVGESEEMRLMDPLTAVEVANANRDLIIGIKVRLGSWTSGIHGMAPFEYALQVAEECGLPIMVHIDDPPPSYDEVVRRLRPGDVLTHCFRPFPNAPLTGDGLVRPDVLAGRERGVLFDIGHGMASFSVKVARQMLENGFMPDTISSDVHSLCIDGPAYDLPVTMSKFLSLGMPLFDVVRATTQAPAQAVRRSDLGTLAVDGIGDASILRIENEPVTFLDGDGQQFEGDRSLRPVGSVIGGELWRPI